MRDVFELPALLGERATTHASAVCDGRGAFGIINNQAMIHACHAINNHDKLVELFFEHKDFNEAMHEMPVEWTIKESQRIHKKTCEFLKELGYEI